MALTKFKVGDIVRVIAQSNGWGQVHAGDIGIVARISREYSCYIVNFFAQQGWKGTEQCFELATPDDNECWFIKGGIIDELKNSLNRYNSGSSTSTSTYGIYSGRTYTATTIG